MSGSHCVTVAVAAAFINWKTSTPACTFIQILHAGCWTARHAVAATIRNADYWSRIACYSPLQTATSTTGYRSPVLTGVSLKAKTLIGGIHSSRVIRKLFMKPASRCGDAPLKRTLFRQISRKTTSSAGLTSSVLVWNGTRSRTTSQSPGPGLPVSVRYKPVNHPGPHPGFRRP